MSAIEPKDHATRPSIVMMGCDPGAPGGISTVIRLLLGSPLSQTWALEVMPTWVSGSRAQQAAAYLKAVGRLWLRLRLQRHPVQALHLHMAARGSFWRKWLIGLVARGSGVVVLVHLHDGTLPQWHAQSPAWVQGLFRRFLEQADATIALSPTWQDKLRALAPLAAWHVVRNPVALEELPCASAWPTDWPSPSTHGVGAPSSNTLDGSPEDTRHLLFLGRLWLDKGLDELLAAAALLQPLHPSWHWTLAGDGDLQTVHERIKALGLAQVINLPGWLDERAKQGALRRADVLVLPSHAEGQPLAVLEAMACARPVVATDVGDIPELLACGAGRVVPVGDAQALAQALHEILLDRPTARAMGLMGRRYVEQRHGVDAVAAQTDALYRKLGLRPTTAAPGDHRIGRD